MSKGFIKLNPGELLTLAFNASVAGAFAVSKYPDYEVNNLGFFDMAEREFDDGRVIGFSLKGGSQNEEPVLRTKEQTELWQALVQFKEMRDSMVFALGLVDQLYEMLTARVIEWQVPKPKPKGFYGN